MRAVEHLAKFARNSARIVVIFTGLSVGSGQAATAKEALRLQVQSPGTGCLSGDKLRASVSEAWGERDVPHDLLVRVREEEAGAEDTPGERAQSQRVSIEFVRGAEVVGKRSLDEMEAGCAQLQDAVSLLIVLGLEELAFERPQQPPQEPREPVQEPLKSQQEPPVVVLAEVAEPKAQEASLSPEREQDGGPSQNRARDAGGLSLRAGAGLSGILAQGAKPLVELGLGYEFAHAGRWSAEIRTGALFTWARNQEIQDLANATVNTRLMAGRGDACLLGPWGMEGCLGGAAGAVRASTDGLAEDGSGVGTWVGACAGLGVSVQVLPGIFLFGRGEMFLAVARPRLIVVDDAGNTAQTHEISLLSGQGCLGAGARF